MTGQYKVARKLPMAYPWRRLPRREHHGISYYDAVSPTATRYETFVLLHGLGSSLDFWNVTAPELSEHARTIAIDIPGFGRSQPGPTSSIDEVAQMIIDLLAHLDAKDIILVGHSLGGIIAMRIIAENPDRFLKLVLVGGTLGRASRLIKKPLLGLKYPQLAVVVAAQFVGSVITIRPRLARIIGSTRITRAVTLWPYVAYPSRLQPNVVASALVDSGGRQSVLRTLTEAPNVDYAALLRKVPRQVDIVWGKADRLINEIDIREAQELANVARVHEITDCGHWPMIEKPEEFTEFVLAPAFRASSSPNIDTEG